MAEEREDPDKARGGDPDDFQGKTAVLVDLRRANRLVGRDVGAEKGRERKVRSHTEVGIRKWVHTLEREEGPEHLAIALCKWCFDEADYRLSP